VIAGILVIMTCEPESRDQESPAWSRATRHAQGIRALAFSADGRALATGGDDGVVIWEVGKGALKVLARDRPSRVQCLAFSADGSILAAGYEGVEVMLWNVETGEIRSRFRGQPKQFQRLAFSPDGRSLACGGAASPIRVWDVETGAMTAELPCRHGMVSALRFGPGGETLAAGYTSGVVKLWDLARGENQELLGSSLRNDPILGLAFSLDGAMLAAGSLTHGTRLWYVATGQESERFLSEHQTVGELAFSPREPVLVEVTQSRLVRQRDVATGRTRNLLRCRGAYCAALSHDARLLAVGDEDAIVRVWDLERGDGGMPESRNREP
jgi:WD40 repeat protein